MGTNKVQRRILLSIKRMWKRGHENTKHYRSLRHKYILARTHNPVNVIPELCWEMGCGINRARASYDNVNVRQERGKEAFVKNARDTIMLCK